MIVSHVSTPFFFALKFGSLNLIDYFLNELIVTHHQLCQYLAPSLIPWFANAIVNTNHADSSVLFVNIANRIRTTLTSTSTAVLNRFVQEILYRAVRSGAFAIVLMILKACPTCDLNLDLVENNSACDVDHDMINSNSTTCSVSAINFDVELRPYQLSQSFNNSILGKHYNITRLLLSDSNFKSDSYMLNSICSQASEIETEIIDLVFDDPRFQPWLKNISSTSVSNLASGGHTNAMKSFLEHVPSTKKQLDFYLYKSLIQACRYGKQDIVQLLLQDGRATPTLAHLKTACSNRHAHILQLLLQDGRAKPSFELLFDEIKGGVLRIAELLVKDGRIDVYANNNALLQRACRLNKPYFAKLLLSASSTFDPTSNYHDLLVDACESGYLGVVRILLKDERFDFRETFEDCLKRAYLNKKSKVLEFLRKDKRIKAVWNEENVERW